MLMWQRCNLSQSYGLARRSSRCLLRFCFSAFCISKHREKKREAAEEWITLLNRRTRPRVMEEKGKGTVIIFICEEAVVLS